MEIETSKRGFKEQLIVRENFGCRTQNSIVHSSGRQLSVFETRRCVRRVLNHQTDGHLASFPAGFTPMWNPVSSW